MGKVYEQLEGAVAEFVTRQPMFFVATAPLSPDGLVNVSPKGLDTFAIVDPTTVAYLDLTGSGAETIAHVRENGRITIMFCAFEGPPRIVRIHGTGRVVESTDAEFAAAAARFPDFPAARAVIEVAVRRIADSCGYAVPRMDFVGQRDTLHTWAGNRSEAELAAYRATKNATSLDGLPALRSVSPT